MLKLSQELLRAVSDLEIRAKRNVTALLAGNYRSAFRGSGMQFKEFRHYEPGDDIRHMSWSVTARTGRPTIKVFEEERELDVVVLVDVSGSSLFGMGKKRKIDMYGELVALIGLAAIKSGDNIGQLLFSQNPGKFLPPKRSREQVHVALTQLLSQPLVGQKSDLNTALTFLRGALRHRSLVIILSDFWIPPFEQTLAAISRRHEVVLLHCYDDAERGYDLSAVYPCWNAETGSYYLLDGRSQNIRRILAENHTNLTNQLEDLSGRLGSDYLSLSVEDDYFQRLVHFFRRRGPSRL